MYALVLFELYEQRKESFEIVGGIRGVEVENSGEREAEEEVVCCAAREVAGCEGGEAREVGAGEEEGVEPVYPALVSATG